MSSTIIFTTVMIYMQIQYSSTLVHSFKIQPKTI